MKRKDLLFELDGPGVSPKTVDSLLLLRLAEAWFRLTIKVADAEGLGLHLSGLDIVDKCAAVAVVPNNQEAAKRASVKTIRVVSGKDDPPRGADGLVSDLRADLRRLPLKYVAKVCVARAKPLKIAVPPIPTADNPWELTELRVYPVRIGGQGKLTVELVSESEPASFTVDVPTLELARDIGHALRAEMDVELEIHRGIDGKIDAGTVRRITVLDDTDTDALRAWFAENASEWEGVEDVVGELGRYN